MKASIIVPVYNEGASVQSAHDAIAAVMASQLPQAEFEIIFVDDGSEDDSFLHLSALCARYSYVRVIKFVRNYGSHMAIRAGLEHASGAVAGFLACDLQDPPELIPTMLQALVDPVQVVWAVRTTREDSTFSRWTARAFYALARRLVSKRIPPRGASMFFLGPQALKAVRLYKEHDLTLEGLFATMGFPQAHVPYERRPRRVGQSKWTMQKRLKLAVDFFVAYSYAPIRFLSYLGIAVLGSGLIYASVIAVRKLSSSPIAAWAPLMALLVVLAGIQMVMMGILGEYVWRVLNEVRSRPRFLIDQILGDGEGEPSVECACQPRGR